LAQIKQLFNVDLKAGLCGVEAAAQNMSKSHQGCGEVKY